MGTKIEWCDLTWNPVTGCSPISEGCSHCYAERMARRLAGRYGYPMHGGFAVSFHEDRLQDPRFLAKSKRIFVCSMADLFHEDVEEQWQTDVFHIMDLARHHTYMILTKRPQTMHAVIRRGRYDMVKDYSHVWLGVTAENQARADERIPVLLRTPGSLKFVSLEPLLGPVNLDDYLNGYGHGDHIESAIIGQETGPGARPAKAEWFFDIISQCKAAGVPVFVKKAPEGVPTIRELPI